jgi:hypothetical protein
LPASTGFSDMGWFSVRSYRHVTGCRAATL